MGGERSAAVSIKSLGFLPPKVEDNMQENTSKAPALGPQMKAIKGKEEQTVLEALL